MKKYIKSAAIKIFPQSFNIRRFTAPQIPSRTHKNLYESF